MAIVIKNLIRDDRAEIIAIAVLLLFLINWNNAISSQLAGKIVHNPQLAHSNSLSLSLSPVAASGVLVVLTHLSSPGLGRQNRFRQISILVCPGLAASSQSGRLAGPVSQSQVMSTTIHTTPSHCHHTDAHTGFILEYSLAML